MSSTHAQTPSPTFPRSWALALAFFVVGCGMRSPLLNASRDSSAGGNRIEPRGTGGQGGGSDARLADAPPLADAPLADAPPRSDTVVVAVEDARDARPDMGVERSADLPSDAANDRSEAMPDLKPDAPSDSGRDVLDHRSPEVPGDDSGDGAEVGREVGLDVGLDSRDADSGDQHEVGGGYDGSNSGLSVLAGILAGPGALDGVGTAAQFYFPSGVAFDGTGNLFVADAANNTIRKIVLATGEVTTVAGALGLTGSDDGIGASARFFSPQGVASDGAGNLYVADSVNSTIRRLVTATGEVTTIAGAAGVSAHKDGRGTAARFEMPMSLAYDGAGNLFVADHDGTIRRIVLATGDVTTVAGNATTYGSQDGTGAEASFEGPQGVVSDGAGNLYVADTGSHTIRKIVADTGVVTTLAGSPGALGIDDGVGSAARFDFPHGLAVDGNGNLFVAEYGSSRIRKLVLATAAVTTLAGVAGYGSVDGPGDLAEFGGPDYLACDGAGNLFATDSSNHTLRKIVIASREVTTFAGLGSSAGSDDGIGAVARFHYPTGLVGDNAGNLLVADSRNQTIRKVVVATGAVSTLAGLANHRGSSDGTGADARFTFPVALAYDGAGSLFVADQDNHLVRKVVLATAVVTTVAGDANFAGSDDGIGTSAHFDAPAAVALDGAGNLFVADKATNVVREIVLASGAVTTLAGAAGVAGNTDGPGTNARFRAPTGLACDGVGNLFVADTGNQTLRKIAIATATVTTLAGAAQFHTPAALTMDGTGNLLVADTQDNTVNKVNVATGMVTTLVGHSGRWETVPGPLPAYIAAPAGLAVLPSGDLAITDQDENVVMLAQF